VAHAGGPRLSAAARSLPPLSPSTNYPASDKPSRTHHSVKFVSTSDILISIKEHPDLLAAGDLSRHPCCIIKLASLEHEAAEIFRVSETVMGI
jgi:hypothetical protein